jgi:hypothetical protein
MPPFMMTLLELDVLAIGIETNFHTRRAETSLGFEGIHLHKRNNVLILLTFTGRKP